MRAFKLMEACLLHTKATHHKSHTLTIEQILAESLRVYSLFPKELFNNRNLLCRFRARLQYWMQRAMMLRYS